MVLSEKLDIRPLVPHAEGVDRPWLPDFAHGLNQMVRDPSRPLSAAWASSLLRSRLYDPQFTQLLDQFHASNPDATASEMQRRLLSAEQDTIFAAQANGDWPFKQYPSYRYADMKMWGRCYAFIKKSPDYCERYVRNVIERGLGTTIPQRTVVVRFLNRVLSHLIGDEPVWANCGSGDMTPDKLVLLSNRRSEFAYDWVRVTDALGDLAISEFKSDLFNEIVDEPNTIRRIVGLDRINPMDPDNLAWSRACCAPEEHLQGSLDRLHARLLRVDVPPEQLVFRMADLTDRDSVRKVTGELGPFHAAAAIFSWYHGTAADRDNKLDNMRKELIMRRRFGRGWDGIIVIVDHARAVRGGRYLVPDMVWKGPTVFVGYKGLLYPVLQGGNGRFGSVSVLPALVRLARRGPYEREVRLLARS